MYIYSGVGVKGYPSNIILDPFGLVVHGCDSERFGALLLLLGIESLGF